MNEPVLIAIISLLGTLSGTFAGILTANRLTAYRIEQLEKKVEQLGAFVERLCVLETRSQLQEEKLNAEMRRVETLEHQHAARQPAS